MMRSMAIASLVPLLVLLGGCDFYDDLPGRPAPNPGPVIAANTPEGFEKIWSHRCAGCHGADGTLGAGRPMRDASYLQGIGKAEMASVIRHGVEGTRMPAFGGDAVDPIPDDDVDLFVEGMFEIWGRMDGVVDSSAGIPWRHEAGGDPTRGAAVFDANCRSCHPSSLPPDGVSDDPLLAGSVTDPFYLRLVSDQHLRSSIVYGRADLGMPGAVGPFRGPDGKVVEGPLDAAEVADLVAYIASFRNTWPTNDERKDGAP